MPQASVAVQEGVHLPSLAQFGAVGAQRSAVVPSISSALDWLRKCVREKPNVRVQVLQTLSSCPISDVVDVAFMLGGI